MKKQTLRMEVRLDGNYKWYIGKRRVTCEEWVKANEAAIAAGKRYKGEMKADRKRPAYVVTVWN